MEVIKTIKVHRATTASVIDVPSEEVTVIPSEDAQIIEAEERLIDDRDMRDRNVRRTEVLDKVKEIIRLPGFKPIPLTLVAEYYGVSNETIRLCFKRHRDEFECDGTKMIAVTDFKSLSVTSCHTLKTATGRGFFSIFTENGTEIRIPNCGIRCFSKRALLRFGMLLRDSEVAKRVRSSLLNIIMETEEQAPEIIADEVSNINTEIEESRSMEIAEQAEEQTLLLDVGKAFATGDIMVFGQAATKLVAFKNKIIASQQNTIKSLETSNTALMETNSTLTETNQTLRESNALLAEKCLKWTNRQTINRLMRCYANEMYIKFSKAWTILWTELKYRHGISVTQRRAASGRFSDTLVSFIRDDEWKCVEQTFAALLEKDGIDPATFYRKAIPHFDDNDLELVEGEG